MEAVDWEVDSLAFSDQTEPESPDVDPEPLEDLFEYGKNLGASEGDQTDPDILLVINQAFHAPLPASWTEHADAEERVYFYNSTTQVSTWNHPMDEVYRELIQLIKKLRNSDAWSQKDQDQRAQVVQDHLLEVHGRFVAQLGDWSGPFRSEDGEEYYFNEKTQFSTWVNPIDDCQNEISIRQAVLSRCLFPASGSQREDVPDSATVPTLHLPIGRGQEADAGAASFSSARSFYTARDSPRSASSPQSFSARSKGSESPPRIRSKGRPARALADLSPVSHQNQMQEQGLDDTRTTATSKASPKIQDATAMSSQESLCIETKTDQDHHGRDPCDGEMDLTFGCSTMPKFPIEELQAASPGGDRESDEPLAHDHVTPASLPPPSNTS